MSANGQHHGNHASGQEFRDGREDRDRAARGYDESRRASHQNFSNGSSGRHTAEQQRSGGGRSSNARQGNNQANGQQSHRVQERQHTNGERQNRSPHRSERSPGMSSSSSRSHGTGTTARGQRAGESSRNGSLRNSAYSMQRYLDEQQRSASGEAGEEPWKMLNSFRYERSGQWERNGHGEERRSE